MVADELSDIIKEYKKSKQHKIGKNMKTMLLCTTHSQAASDLKIEILADYTLATVFMCVYINYFVYVFA